MKWLKRIGFLVALNIVVVLTISFITNALGLNHYMTARGIDYRSLIGLCFVWGMGGAFISLLISKQAAKWMMGVKIINPNSTHTEERELVRVVHHLARQAGLTKMPEVGYYESPEINAFATGPSRNNSLVAVSSGLLQRMNAHEVEGVLGHEVSHIANGDMVTMTLIQGVVNAFVMALARIIAFAISSALRDRNERGGLGGFAYIAVVWILEMLLFIPGSMMVAYFSRIREFRADQGGAKLAGRQNMISALQSLLRLQEVNLAAAEVSKSSPAFAALKISSAKRAQYAALFSTHPPLKERIQRLERGGF